MLQQDQQKKLSKQAKGRQKFTHQGKVIYEWQQQLEEVHMYLQPPQWAIPKYQQEFKKNLKPGQSLPKLEVTIKSDHISIGVKGNPPFLNEDLGGKVNASQSLWMIQDDQLHIILQKMYKAEVWEQVCKGHQTLDPFTKGEVQKKVMLQRFQQQNPGFDFSGAQFNGMVPNPREFMGGVKYT